MNEKRKQRVLLIAANSGTAFWRVRNPLEYLRDMNLCDMCWVQFENIPRRDRYWMEQWDTVVVHQLWNDEVAMFVQYMKSIGRRIILSVDDLINGFKIPQFIKGGQLYRDNGIVHNVHDMMVLADKIVVTQPFLAKQLEHYFELDAGKFVIFPNLPMYNWMSKMFNPNLKVENFKKRNGHLRVGIISSLSHYELDENGNQNADDLSLVVEAAKFLQMKNVNDLTWVMPVNQSKVIMDRLTPYAKVENRQMVAIRDYPTSVQKMDLDLVVVPLQKNDFNDSKSNIKLVECAALGIPTLVSDSFAYDGFIDKQYVFNNSQELADKLLWARSWSEKRYRDLIVNNYKRFYDAPSDYYGVKINGYWLEANMQLIADTFLTFNQTEQAVEQQNGIVAPKLDKQNIDGGTDDGKKE